MCHKTGTVRPSQDLGRVGAGACHELVSREEEAERALCVCVCGTSSLSIHLLMDT